MLSNSSIPQAAARPYPTRGFARRNREGSPEQRAHDRLIAALASDEAHRLQRCVEVVRDYFHADSAGLHVVPSAAIQGAGALDVVCGLFESHDPLQTRLGSGLAKLCFAARTPIVLSQQEIELTFLRHLRPRIVHILMAPIYDDHQQPLGAIWLAQVNSALTYSRADTLILQRISQDLALGLVVHEREQEQAALACRLENRCTQLEEQLQAQRLRCEEAEASAVRANKAVSYETTLLREAHHRVKNTLQISSSLLSLQAHAATLNSTRVALREAAARLRLVMHVHEQLYAPDRRSTPVAALHLLNSVIGSLSRNCPEGKQRITLRATSDDIEMSFGECTSLMIIVNELVTNAFKHGFPDDLQGSINVALKREAGTLVLRVSDTGIGMRTPSLDTHFGLTLVRSLANQLGGSLTFANSLDPPGTLVTLAIPDREQRIRPELALSPSKHIDTTTVEVTS
jgi:two-component sensor histidine kinase